MSDDRLLILADDEDVQVTHRFLAPAQTAGDLHPLDARHLAQAIKNRFTDLIEVNINNLAAVPSIIFGLLAAPVCYFAIRLIKHRFHIDDSLDVFAVHGVGGMLGTLLFAVFGLAAFGGTTEGVTFGDQFIAQLTGIAVVGGYSAVATALIALAVSLFLPMRVGEESERHGLDSASHGEHAFKLD